MFSLTPQETLIQSAGVLNTIAPNHLPPRLSLVPLEQEEKEEDAFLEHYEPLNQASHRLRLRSMQRAHRRTTRLTRSGLEVEAKEGGNANKVPFHTNNPYVQMGFWSYLAYNLTDPCCGTSDWFYDVEDYDGDLDDVNVDDNGLFWRDYNPKRELYDLQLQVQDLSLSERKRSYLERKIEHMTRDPLDDYFDEDETLLTMDESLVEGNMSGMEVAFRKYKCFEREQRHHRKLPHPEVSIQSTYLF